MNGICRSCGSYSWLSPFETIFVKFVPTYLVFDARAFIFDPLPDSSSRVVGKWFCSLN